MKLPCILKTTGGHVVCLFENGVGYHLDGQYKGVVKYCEFGIAESDKNITAEYLANTYGEVKSKEHAEFIKLLAETNKIPCAVLSIDMNYTLFYVINGCLFFLINEIDTFCDYKKITIPLPPECESVDEWPMVGDDVVLMSGKGKVVALPDNHGNYVIVTDKGFYLLASKDDIIKPKTPEQELRDELISAMDDSNTAFQYAEYLAKYLLDQYELTKKPQ